MRDTFARRAYAFLVLCGIAWAARLQASGLSTLLADAYLEPPLHPRRVAPALEGDADAPRRSARLILSRNPFDSVTGPLNAVPDDGEPAANSAGSAAFSSPLAAPECTDVVARGVTESTDPTWSMTVLLDGPTHPPVLRRVGDPLGPRRVAFIGYNLARNSPSVWLSSGSRLCQVLLFGAFARVSAPEHPSRLSGAALPKSITDRIKRMSPTEFQLDRSVVEDVLGDRLTLLQSIRIVPEQRDGKVVALKLVGIRPGSLLSTLGLQSGDLLERINGFDVTDPGRALEAYARLRTAEKLEVLISRKGHPMNIVLEIR